MAETETQSDDQAWDDRVRFMLEVIRHDGAQAINKWIAERINADQEN